MKVKFTPTAFGKRLLGFTQDEYTGLDGLTFLLRSIMSTANWNQYMMPADPFANGETRGAVQVCLNKEVLDWPTLRGLDMLKFETIGFVERE